MAGGRTVLRFAIATVVSSGLAMFALGCGAGSDGTTTGTAATPRSEPSPPARAAGVVVPAIRVRGMDNTETELTSALRGRPALITLWATWCDACRDEMPALNRLDAWAKERGAVVIGVAVGESLTHVSSFAAANKLPYLVLVDEGFHLADALGEKRVPSTLIIDRNGRIVYVGGAVDNRSLAAFRSVLAGDEVAQR